MLQFRNKRRISFRNPFCSFCPNLMNRGRWDVGSLTRRGRSSLVFR
jgi:hypothetical protein